MEKRWKRWLFLYSHHDLPWCVEQTNSESSPLCNRKFARILLSIQRLYKLSYGMVIQGISQIVHTILRNTAEYRACALYLMSCYCGLMPRSTAVIWCLNRLPSASIVQIVVEGVVYRSLPNTNYGFTVTANKLKPVQQQRCIGKLTLDRLVRKESERKQMNSSE